MTDTLLWQINLASTSYGYYSEVVSGDNQTSERTPTCQTMTGALRAASDLVADLHPQLLLRDVRAEQALQTQKLDEILSAFTRETQRDIYQEKQVAKKLAEIVADAKKNAEDQQALIAAQTTVLDGVKVFIQGQAAQVAALKQQIQELIDAGGDPVQLSELEKIVAAMQAQEDALTANTAAIAEAVAANTEPQQ